MPPNSRSYAPSDKRTTLVFRTKPRIRFMSKLPPELREMVYGYMMGPRTMEVKFMSNEEAAAYAEAIKAARPSNITATRSQSKYIVLDNDPTDTDYAPIKKSKTPPQTFKFINTSPNKLVLHAINRETRAYALRHYIPIFKTAFNPTGILFNFDLDFLAFTTQYMQVSPEKKFQFIGRKGFSADVARIRNVAYLFLCHYNELDRVHRGNAKARTFVTRFPGLRKFVVTLPLEHVTHCRYCYGGLIPAIGGTGGGGGEVVSVSPMEVQAKALIKESKNDFEELKKKMRDSGVEWRVPDLAYETHCWNQKWTLRLDGCEHEQEDKVEEEEA